MKSKRLDWLEIRIDDRGMKILSKGMDNYWSPLVEMTLEEAEALRKFLNENAEE